MIYALKDDTLASRPEKEMREVNEGELNPEGLDSHVPAAAVWVVYAGRRIWKLAQKRGEASRTTRGGLGWWSGPLSHCMERPDLSARVIVTKTQARQQYRAEMISSFLITAVVGEACW